jgi:hypothetical protein
MKNIFLCILLLMAVNCYAQEDRLFSEAISRGRQPNGSYIINNSSKKAVTIEEMTSYVKRKGYAVLGYNTQIKKQFGNAREVVDRMEFISTQDYPQYVFSVMSGGTINYSQLKKGSFFQPAEEKQYTKHGIVEVLSGVKTVFWRNDNVLWTGSLSNGFLHGNGKAFWIKGTNECHYLEGTFEYGFPKVIKTSTYIAQHDIGSLNRQKSKEFKMKAVTSEMIAANANTSDSKLKQAINLSMGGSYDSDVAKLDAAYKKAKTLSSSNYSNFKADPIVARFVNNYGKTNHDPKKRLPTAQAIKDAYYVCAALQYPIQERYYGVNNFFTAIQFNGSIDWLNKEVKGDRDLFTKGLNIAKNGKNNNQYGFRTFYSQAIPLLENKLRRFENKVASDRKYYEQKMQSVREKNQRIHNELSKEIDWERSKEPSGKYYESGLFQTWGKYENDGSIYFKAGSEYVTYQAYYDDNRVIHHYSILYASRKINNNLRKREFKRRDEMLEAILNAVK